MLCLVSYPFALSLSKGRSFFRRRKKGRCFDKLSTNGMRAWLQRSQFRHHFIERFAADGNHLVDPFGGDDHGGANQCRKSVVSGKNVLVRVDTGGRGCGKNKNLTMS